MFSGVNCAGLIEAGLLRVSLTENFPPFSGVNCAGLIEASPLSSIIIYFDRFSGVNCAGLIEALFFRSSRSADM